jgi:hypothetical protein
LSTILDNKNFGAIILIRKGKNMALELYIGLSNNKDYPGIICKLPSGMTIKQVEQKGDYVYRKNDDGWERVRASKEKNR